MDIQEWDISRIIPYENNPRVISAEAVDKVAASLQRFGWQQPIVVEPDGVIVVGHTRWRAALQLGWTTAPVKVASDLTEEELIAYRIADNKTGEYSQWDFGLLGKEAEALADSDFDLSLTGFDVADLEGLFPSAQPGTPWNGEPGADGGYDDDDGGDGAIYGDGEPGTATVSIAADDAGETAPGTSGGWLKFGSQAVPLSQDEQEALGTLLSAFSERFGTFHGFTRWLISGRTATDVAS